MIARQERVHEQLAKWRDDLLDLTRVEKGKLELRPELRFQTVAQMSEELASTLVEKPTTSWPLSGALRSAADKRAYAVAHALLRKASRPCWSAGDCDLDAADFTVLRRAWK